MNAMTTIVVILPGQDEAAALMMGRELYRAICESTGIQPAQDKRYSPAPSILTRGPRVPEYGYVWQLGFDGSDILPIVNRLTARPEFSGALLWWQGDDHPYPQIYTIGATTKERA